MNKSWFRRLSVIVFMLYVSEIPCTGMAFASNNNPVSTQSGTSLWSITDYVLPAVAGTLNCADNYPQAYPISDSWIYPVNSQIPSQHMGPSTNPARPASEGYYHQAEDYDAVVYGAVLAAANGWVVCTFVGLDKENFGHAVFVQSVLPTGEHITAVYGHLAAWDLIAPGTNVEKGDMIGRIGSYDENGHFEPHLHIGIRLGHYKPSNEYGWPNGEWGYTKDLEEFNHWRALSDYVQNPPSPQPTWQPQIKPAYFRFPWWYTFYTCNTDPRTRAYLNEELLFDTSPDDGSEASRARTVLVLPGGYRVRTLVWEISGNPVDSVSWAPWPTGIACAQEPIVPPPTPLPGEPQPEPGATPPPISATYDAEFISDITCPDGTIVLPSSTLVKTWRIRNTGRTTWDSGYQLVFVGGNQMGAPGAVSIPTVAPGQTVNLSVNLTTPNAPGTHRGDWRLRNPQGTYFGDPLWVIVNIPDANGAPPPPSGVAIDLDCTNCPATVAPGQSFWPTIRATVNDGQLLQSRGDMLRNKDGNLYGAYQHVAVQGTVSQGQLYDFTFYADNPMRAPIQEGTYESKWQVWRNGNWAGEEYTIRFTVSQSGGNNRPPNRPTLTGPGDWAVYQGTQVVLTAQHNGDPDSGDTVAQYYFDIFDSAQNANSGWISSNSWSPSGLGYNNYQWRAKVRDNHGNESAWSEPVWHFSVLNNNAEIYEFYTTPCRDAWGGAAKICFCTRTNAGTQKIMINRANDGSTSGEWDGIVELGTPNFTCNTDTDRPPNLDPLPYESGTHVVRLYARRDGGWENAAWRDITVSFPADRRPNIPPLQLPLHQAYVSSKTVRMEWKETLRTTSYRLEASSTADYSTLLLDQYLPVGTTNYNHTFASDYETVYWRVTATGPYGSNQGSWIFHIDLTAPSSGVAALPAITTDTRFSVNWSGSDTRAGLRWYHVQVRDISRPGSEWEDWLVNTTKTVEMFQGQPGHSYAFRVRAMDNVGNWETWPGGNGDTSTKVDPSAIPPTAWWNMAYTHKRNLLVLNNDSDMLPAAFPVSIHFDTTTTPTAAEIYNASLAATKGNDVRIVFNDTSELHRFVQRFTPTVIDIWFPLQAALGGGASNGNYQIYYGNAGAGSPPANVNEVFLPKTDGNTMGLWHFQEGSGSAVGDTSGRYHNGDFTSAAWTNGFLGYAGHFNGSDAYVNMGNHSDFNLTAMTIEAWVYLTASPGSYPHVISKWSSNQGRSYFLRIMGGGDVQFQISGDGGDRSVVGGRLTTNRWYHIAGVHDGNRNMWVYVDGEQKGYNGDSRPAFGTNAPLTVGRDPTWGGTAFPGFIQHVRVSNVARYDFPYAKVNVAPSVAAGVLIDPPTAGTADLVLRDLATHPNLSGGLLVVAAVKNQGNAPTQNNFYTDLYVDHLPGGAGDFNGSLRFWINAPIAAGSAVTLTTVLTETGALRQLTALNAGPAEVNLTLYAQTDSTGVIGESDNQNNITASGVEACLAAADAYEDDDIAAQATLFTINTDQQRNFDSLSDHDWIKFQAQAGVTYTIHTTDLAAGADTYVYLYDRDGVTLLAANDDYGGSLASQIDWEAPTAGIYYLLIQHWNPNVGGCGTGYTVSVADARPDTTPPIGRITSPANGAIIGTCPVTIQAEVSDSESGVSFVEFHAWYDGNWHHLGNDSTSPYGWSWDCSSVSNQEVQLTIHAWDNAGNEIMDPGGYVYVTLAHFPGAPSSLSATSSSSTWISLNWSDNSNNETGFKIERSANGTSGWTQISTVGANATTYNNTGLICGTPYYYRVRSYNTAGNSTYSNTANATTSACPTSSRIYLPLIVHEFQPYAVLASFSADLLHGAPPLTVRFANQSTGPVISWLWTFGDGKTSNLQNPIHVYAQEGVYTVSLQVFGPAGNHKLIKQNYITVGYYPQSRLNDDYGSALQTDPTLALDTSGNAFAVWTDERGGTRDIYFSRKLLNTNWSTNELVNRNTTDIQDWADLAIDANSTVHVIWNDSYTDYYADLYVGTRPLNGIWSASTRINDITCAGQHFGSIVIDSSGRASVAWMDWRAMNYDIYFSQNSSDNSWSTSVKVNTDSSAADQYNPSLAVDQTGNLYIVWADERNGHSDIYFSYRPVNGQWGANVKVNDDIGTTEQRLPTLAIDEAGTVYVVWEDKRNGDSDIYFSQRSSTGIWTQNQRLNDDAGVEHQFTPQIAVDESGNVQVVWQDYRLGNAHIFHTYRPSSGAWKANTRIDSAGTYHELPSLAVDNTGRVHIAWADNRNGNLDIYHTTFPMK